MLKQWFVPRPWGVAEATLDVRPGGSSVVVMHDPEGNQYPNRGVYLEIVENEKIVFTDAYTSAWVPSEKPFFTGVILLEDLGNGRTIYGHGVALARRGQGSAREDGFPRRMGQGCGPIGGAAGEDMSGAVRRRGETASS